jgi:rubrerythrin
VQGPILQPFTKLVSLMEAVMKNAPKSIKMALHNELQEHAFHLQQSKKMSSFVGREMLLRLASDEDEHYRRLQKIHEEFSLNDSRLKMVPCVTKKNDIMNTLHQLVATARKIPAVNRNDLHELQIAVGFEKWGCDFYLGLSRFAEDASEKEFFKLLASMERAHLLSLQETMLYYESPAAWRLKLEKPHLDSDQRPDLIPVRHCRSRKEAE